MTTSTLNFKEYNTAKLFTSEWSAATKRGHTLSAKNVCGGAVVTLHNVTDSERDFIDGYMKKANA